MAQDLFQKSLKNYVNQQSVKAKAFALIIFLIIIFPITCLGQNVLVLDPGHPSETSAGNQLIDGLREVDVNWDLCRELATELRRESSLSILLTRRQKDELSTNKARAQIANAAGAFLFLRVHCDAGKGSGFTIYYPDRPGSAQGESGPPLEICRRSEVAAKAFHTAFKAVLQGRLKDNGMRPDSQTYVGSKQGALTGSVFARVPVVLVELLYLTNPQDRRFLRSEQGRKALLQAMKAGIMACRNLPPFAPESKD